MKRVALLIATPLLVFLCATTRSSRAHEVAQPGGAVGGGIGAGGAVVSFIPCQNGFAGIYPCHNVDLQSYMPLSAIGGGDSANDIWGWTDPLTGKEYAIIGKTNGTAFVDISNAANPRYLGDLPTATIPSPWREMKTYQNYVLIVSEASFHGMQVFDLTQLRSVGAAPVTFSATALYGGFSNCHNIVVDETSGFAYCVGSNTCSGGPHMIDMHDPTHPTFAGCFSADGYTHDAQCVMYAGPHAAYAGHEICLNSNEDTLTIVDVTTKSAPVMLSRTGYAGRGYTHQGWLTNDQAYFLLDDEFDERNFAHNTWTYVWDVSDLAAPVLLGHYTGASTAIDHNQYTRLLPSGEYTFQANYRSGLRVLRIDNPATVALHEVAFFDVYPGDDSPGFNGAWGNYHFFPSGNVVISGIEQGLFVVRPNLVADTPTPTASPTGTSVPTTTPTPSAVPTSSQTATQTAPPTETATPGPPGFSGHVRYRDSGLPVGDVTVHLFGSTAAGTHTDSNGQFALTDLSADNWRIEPEDHAGRNGAITALDASYVLQAAVGLRVPDAAERLAGDVNGSGTLTAIDAALILQLAVGLIADFPAATRCGTNWLFVPSAMPAPNQSIIPPQMSGTCQHGAIAIEPLTSHAAGQDFVAALLGDTAASWQPPGGGCASVLCRAPAPPPAMRASGWRRDRNGRLRLVLYLAGGKATTAVDLQLRYNPRHLRAVGVRRTAATRGALIAFNAAAPGHLRIALASAEPLQPQDTPALFVLFDGRDARAARSRVRISGGSLR